MDTLNPLQQPQEAFPLSITQLQPVHLLKAANSTAPAKRQQNLEAAQNRPDKVKALILLEPAGAPNPSKIDVTKVKDVKMLVVWGDNFDKSKLWQSYRANVEKYLDAVKKAGGSVEVIDLPTRGIRGNSHMMILDRNSNQIAQLILDWAKRENLSD